VYGLSASHRWNGFKRFSREAVANEFYKHLNLYGVKSVNIQLKSEQEQFIRSQIDRGEYQNAENVISEAFKLLEARTNKIKEIRQKIAVGTAEIANGQMTDGEMVFEIF
jgi:antitoxin ParD1/3/4